MHSIKRHANFIHSSNNTIQHKVGEARQPVNNNFSIVLNRVQNLITNNPRITYFSKLQNEANVSLQVQQAIKGQVIIDQSVKSNAPAFLIKEYKTGLPDSLKTGIENLSGYCMNDVKVYYNSNMPEQFQALAYAQGTNIHLAAGQAKHLSHEAWHVVQQKQGRVNSTLQKNGTVLINDNTGLEREADVMGQRALQPLPPEKTAIPEISQKHSSISPLVLQRVKSKVKKITLELERSLEDIIGELISNSIKSEEISELHKLFAEQFPNKEIKDLVALFGLNGLQEIEMQKGEVDNQVVVTLIKDAEKLHSSINHNYIYPMEHFLKFGGINENPWMKIYKWFKREAAPPDMTLKLFKSIIKAGESLDLSFFNADAIGDGVDFDKDRLGYYVWVRYGFDKVIEELNTIGDNSKLEDSFLGRVLLLSNGSDLDDLHETANWFVENYFVENNKRFVTLNGIFLAAEVDGILEKITLLWKKIDVHVQEALFDLSSDSNSQKVLDSYLTSRKLNQ